MGHESRGAPLDPLSFDLILAFGHEAPPSGVVGVDPDLVDLKTKKNTFSININFKFLQI